MRSLSRPKGLVSRSNRRQIPVSPPATSINALHSMQGNRARDTKPEVDLRRALRQAGLFGYRLHIRGLAGRPDVAFTRAKLAIFVHGCFWHRCPHCRPELPKRNRAFWERKFLSNAERDERKRRQLEAMGWTVLEIWECEVDKDAMACAKRVGSHLVAIDQAQEAAEERALTMARGRKLRKGRNGRA